jgi:hypothetical protein
VGVRPLPVPVSHPEGRDPYWATGYDLILDTDALASWVTYHEAQGHRLENYQGEELQGFWCMDCDRLAACHTKNFHQRGKLYMTWQRLRVSADPEPEPRASLLDRINQTIDDLNVWADDFWGKHLDPLEDEIVGGGDNQSAFLDLVRHMQRMTDQELAKEPPKPEREELPRPPPYSMCQCVKCSRPMMRFEERCSRCGFILPFCPNCGSSGSAINRDRRDCSVCGHSFSHLPTEDRTWVRREPQVLQESYRRMQQYQPRGHTDGVKRADGTLQDQVP